MAEVTTSFFYGGSSAPEQNTVDQLIDSINSSVTQAEAANASAQVAAAAAAGSAASASVTVQSAADLVEQANSIISHFTISTSLPTGGVEGDVWFKVLS